MVYAAGIASFFGFMASYSFWLLRHSIELVSITVVCAVAFVGMTLKWKRNRPLHKPLGVIALAGLVLGAFLGAWNYDVQGFYAQMYRSLRTYSNVEPGQLAGTVRDAGRLNFADEAAVDVDSGVGYAEVDGTKYCVAPITAGGSNTSGSQDTPVLSVQFWAVGVDCCDWSGSFTCGAARDSSAHSGIVQFERRGLFNRTDWIYEGWDLARKKAEGALDLAPVSRPMYVRWATSADLGYRDWVEMLSAWVIIVVDTVVFAVFAFFVVRRMLEAEAKRLTAQDNGWSYH